MRNLAGITVLVTRPQPAANELCGMLEQAGARALCFPVIAIESLLHTSSCQQQLTRIKQQDWLIFTSPQAVNVFQSAMEYLFPLPKDLQIAAVGTSTAFALEAAGVAVNTYPEKEWSSEGLLCLVPFSPSIINGKKIAIIAGEDGRTILAEELSARGAEVTTMTLYRRILPTIDVAPIKMLLENGEITVIIATSVTCLTHLDILLERQKSALRQVPLIVVGERIAYAAKKLGFQTIWVATHAKNSAIMGCLASHYP